MSSHPDSWVRLQEAFEGALELESNAERDAYLARVLADAPELLDEARSMLRAHESPAPPEIERRLLSDEGSPEGALAGRSIGAYRLEALIGRGGMGEVYRGEREGAPFRQQVAVKVLRPGVHGAEAAARFRLERQILARLSHPLIVPLLDGGVTEDGRPYLVLPYVAGEPITEYCERRGLPLAGRLALFCKVARALEYAHRHLVVHRDLKPPNILVTEEGQVHLLDFGIAKLLDPSPDDDVPTTRAELRVMTPDYAAPEQIRGGPVTTVTDVYALGALLYEILTGERPFADAQAGRAELERRVLEEDPVPPSEAVAARRRRRRNAHPSSDEPAVGPEPSSERVRTRGAEPHTEKLAKRLRGDLDTIVLKALQKEPERRYSSAEQMALDVERHLAGQPVLARRPSFRYRFEKLVRRNPTASALTALSVLLLVALAATATYQSSRIARERDTARAEQERAEKVVGVLVDLFASSNPREVPGGKDLTVGEFLQKSEERLLQNPDLKPETQARLKQVLGKAYLERSQYDRARILLADARAQFASTLGEGDAATASVFADQARLARETEPAAKAIPLLRESLERQRRLVGVEHESFAAAEQELAAALPASAEKEQLLLDALRIRRARLRAPSMELASSLNEMGIYYINTDRPDHAERHLKESLQIIDRMYPTSRHPNAMTVLTNLAVVQQRRGDLNAAYKTGADLIELKEKLFGTESSQVSVAYGNQGVTLAEMGKHAEAEKSFRRALELHRKIFGPEHTQVANTLRNIALVLYLQEKYAEALPLLRDALEMFRRVGSEEGPLATIEAQLGKMQFRLGRKQEGLAAVRAVVERLKAKQPSGTTLADMKLLLAGMVLESGDGREAEALARDTLENRRAASPPHLPKIADAECALGRALALQGKTREARELLERALPGYASWGFSDPAEVRRARQQLEALRAGAAKF